MIEGRVSAVSYVIEPPGLWSQSVTGGPRFEESSDDPAWVIGDYRCRIPAIQLEAVLAPPVDPGATVRLSELPDEVFRPKGRLMAQERAGLAAEVLYPTPVLWGSLALVLDAETELACARVYNDWLAEFASAAPDRFVGVAQIPSQGGLEVALAELRRVRQLGFKAIQIRAFPSGPSLTPDDDKFFSEVVEYGLVLSFDKSFGPAIGDSGMQFNGGNNGTAPLESLIYSGVLDRFPELRMVVVSPTAGWIPYWLERTDDSFCRTAVRMTWVRMSREMPSDYLRTRPFYTFSGNDLLLNFPDCYIAASHLMWSSQYPTFFAAEAAEVVGGMEGVDPAIQGQLLGGTCRGLYGLKGGTPVNLEPAVPSLPHAIPV
jgi:predicted TIM-barrel fold metal-dependent hydrolase